MREGKKYIITVFSVVLFFSGMLFFVSVNGVNNLRISEICSNNSCVYIPEYDGYCDYVELQNSGLLALDGEEIYISDENDKPSKMVIEDLKLLPGEYLVIGVDEKDFAISKEGENIYLFDEFGNLIDSVYSKAQEEDVSYSWMNDAREWCLRTCTPGESNLLSNSLTVIESPAFSHESGFYENEFELELEVSNGATIYYTLDGSVPTKDSQRYENPICVYDKSREENVWRSVKNVVPDWINYEPDTTIVDKAFIINAVAIDSEGNQSEVATASYFIDKEEYVNKRVISLIADPEELFGDDGIYVTGKEYDEWYLNGSEGEEILPNFRISGRQSEIQAVFQLFEGECLAEQNIGMRIQGGSRRKNAMKRFALIARNEYCKDKWFEYELFKDKRTHSVVLREGFANAVIPYLVQGRDLTMQQAVPVDVFLNGEYWYTTYMQEKISETFLEEEYNLKNGNAIIVKSGASDSLQAAEKYEEVCKFVETNDMSVADNYIEVCNKIDVQSFIDFICINTYLCNLDWDDEKNYVVWSSDEITDNPYEDGRFRWVLHDMDAMELLYGMDGSVIGDVYSLNAFSKRGPYVQSAVNETIIFRNLKANEEFCRNFVVSFMDIANTCFSNDNLTRILGEWNSDLSWCDNFFTKRAEYVFKHLEEEFGLTGTKEKLTVHLEKENSGNIMVNTTSIKISDGRWEGFYYTDYPVTLSVVENSGYKFVAWKDKNGEVVSTDKTVEIGMVEGGVDICAVFEKEE